MGGELIEGALLAGVGIVVVFITLAILMVVMLLLHKGFRGRGEEPMPTTAGTESIVYEEGEESSEEVVAAIALALSLAQSEPAIPVPSEDATRARRSSRWAIYGRQQIMDSRGRARKQW
ncbi:MAG: hypothetical protein DRI26_04120 [Chloroflexi bacterium]|nr:MAG: hypothetical protein DRI26_04120 [Chloroflexota bacterium]